LRVKATNEPRRTANPFLESHFKENLSKTHTLLRGPEKLIRSQQLILLRKKD
jgi:hypothetical protein